MSIPIINREYFIIFKTRAAHNNSEQLRGTSYPHDVYIPIRDYIVLRSNRVRAVTDVITASGSIDVFPPPPDAFVFLPLFFLK